MVVSSSRPSRRSRKPAGRSKTSRIELRTTLEDRDLLDSAAAALGLDRSAFVLTHGRLAAQRVLADRVVHRERVHQARCLAGASRGG
ncbi:DUF1778 domain-containing protein [Cyanobium sp. A1C-AMD]|uniref:type II toxin-antitoxin system TacA family antitoxin n=1 Tax=Cyanobium sp. A1C-AMD TaxID=2823694 RepID=UPI0020CBB8C4|nr:DUF1778 domain-containing protein [Cyanobium sp. A1C-AMD]